MAGVAVAVWWEWPWTTCVGLGGARVALRTPLNSGIRWSFRQQRSIFFRNAELVDKVDGMTRGWRVHRLRVVSHRCRTAPQR